MATEFTFDIKYKTKNDKESIRLPKDSDFKQLKIMISGRYKIYEDKSLFIYYKNKLLDCDDSTKLRKIFSKKRESLTVRNSLFVPAEKSFKYFCSCKTGASFICDICDEFVCKICAKKVKHIGHNNKLIKINDYNAYIKQVLTNNENIIDNQVIKDDAYKFMEYWEYDINNEIKNINSLYELAKKQLEDMKNIQIDYLLSFNNYNKYKELCAKITEIVELYTYIDMDTDVYDNLITQKKEILENTKDLVKFFNEIKDNILDYAKNLKNIQNFNKILCEDLTENFNTIKNRYESKIMPYVASNTSENMFMSENVENNDENEENNNENEENKEENKEENNEENKEENKEESKNENIENNSNQITNNANNENIQENNDNNTVEEKKENIEQNEQNNNNNEEENKAKEPFNSDQENDENNSNDEKSENNSNDEKSESNSNDEKSENSNNTNNENNNTISQSDSKMNTNNANEEIINTEDNKNTDNKPENNSKHKYLMKLKEDKIIIFSINKQNFKEKKYIDKGMFYSYNEEEKDIINLNTNKKLFLLGGKNYNNFFYYDYKSNTLFFASNTLYSHQYGEMIYCPKNNSIYLLGGSDQKNCEKCCIDSMQSLLWEDIPEFNEERREFAAIYYKDYIYIFFGISVLKSSFVSSIERLNIDKNDKFEIIYSNENISLSSAGCCIYRDINDNDEIIKEYIMILGGYDEDKYVDKSVLFDLEELELKECEISIPNLDKHKQFLFRKEPAFVEYEFGYQYAFDNKYNVHLLTKDSYELFSQDVKKKSE